MKITPEWVGPVLEKKRKKGSGLACVEKISAGVKW